MPKNRFVNSSTKRIELEDGNWIEVKEELTFEEYGEIMKNVDLSLVNKLEGEAEKSTISNFDIGLPLLKAALVDWSFKDDEGKKIECTLENISKLRPAAIMELLEPVSELIQLDFKEEKKSSQSSKPTSSRDTGGAEQKTK